VNLLSSPFILPFAFSMTPLTSGTPREPRGTTNIRASERDVVRRERWVAGQEEVKEDIRRSLGEGTWTFRLWVEATLMKS